MNQKVKPGDKILLLHMEGESKPSIGDKGVVYSITRDPMEDDNLIISVKWEDGSTLSILSKYDFYKVIETAVNESDSSNDRRNTVLINNIDIIKPYSLSWFKNYLELVRKSGITNMFGASPFLYSGREHIDRYYGEGREDDENFQNLLNDADEARNRMISGTMKFLEMKGMDPNDLNAIKTNLTRNANKILSVWMGALH
jgi:hypothetical protein